MVVVPAVVDNKIPVEPILATPGLVEDHVPPAARSLNMVADPWQMLVAPRIADGDELTVTVTVVALEQPPFVEVTVYVVVPEGDV